MRFRLRERLKINCGALFWSEGVVVPRPSRGGGYGRVIVGANNVTLQAIDDDGAVRLSYEVTP
jgi:hypothetical protein